MANQPKAAPRKPPMKAHKYIEREPTSTKRGPGRRHVSGHSHAVKRVKEAGGYGKGLVAVWTRAQLQAIEAKRARAA